MKSILSLLVEAEQALKTAMLECGVQISNSNEDKAMIMIAVAATSVAQSAVGAAIMTLKTIQQIAL